MRVLSILLIMVMAPSAFAIDYSKLKANDKIMFAQNTQAYDLDSAWHIFKPKNGQRWDEGNEQFPNTLTSVVIPKGTIATLMKDPWIKVYVRGRTFADCSFTVKIGNHHYVVENSNSINNGDEGETIQTVRNFETVMLIPPTPAPAVMTSSAE